MIEKTFSFIKADVDIRITIDCDVIQRNGKKYVDIKKVHSQLNVPELTQHAKYENIGPFLSNIANGVLDSNWKHLLDSISSDLESHIGNIIKAILGPIFDEIPITEFTHEHTDSEEDSAALELQNLSISRSSSVVEKLTFSLLTWSLLFILF